jgi:hypothetical protein
MVHSNGGHMKNSGVPDEKNKVWVKIKFGKESIREYIVQYMTNGLTGMDAPVIEII